MVNGTVGRDEFDATTGPMTGTGGTPVNEFLVDGAVRSVSLPGRLTVNNSDTMADLARRGFGLIQAPRYRFRQDLADGVLVEVLKDFPLPPTPLAALYPQNRQLSLRVRVFLDWIAKIFAEADL